MTVLECEDQEVTVLECEMEMWLPGQTGGFPPSIPRVQYQTKPTLMQTRLHCICTELVWLSRVKQR